MSRGPACGTDTYPETKPGEALRCDGWHPRRGVWCGAPARFAITSRFLIRLARTQRVPRPRPFHRCAPCARPYRVLSRWSTDPGDFIVERLMDPPPRQVLA